MWDILLDAFLDVLKILPILYLVYLLVSYLGHNNNNKYARLMNKTKKFGPVIGAVTGAIPQCGFSVVMADLYSKKAITLGTLIAVFISTSDEAIPLMISDSKFILPMLVLIAIKIVSAIVFGYAIDFIIKLVGKQQPVNEKVFSSIHSHECELTSCSLTQELHDDGETHKHNHLHNCGHEHKNNNAQEECCVHNVFLDALKHTATIALFLFLATLFINIVVEYAGVDNLKYLFTSNKFIQPFIAGLIGLIPNCASSVFLVQFFMSGGITFGAMLAGLTAGSGVGLLVLFSKNKKNIKSNLLILATLYALGVVLGILFTIIPIKF